MDVSPISFPLIPLSMGTTRPKESEKPIPDDLILRELSYVKKHLLPYSAHALAAHILGGAHVSGLLIDKQEAEGFPQKLEITDDPIVANYLKELSSLEAVDREHG